MDDEQEAQKAKRAAIKDKEKEKVKIKKEINTKLYFLMAALFASISIMEIVYQIYAFSQEHNELVVYQTMKHLVCYMFPLITF
jgi:hypothetical protein